LGREKELMRLERVKKQKVTPGKVGEAVEVEERQQSGGLVVEKQKSSCFEGSKRRAENGSG